MLLERPMAAVAAIAAALLALGLMMTNKAIEQRDARIDPTAATGQSTPVRAAGPKALRIVFPTDGSYVTSSPIEFYGVARPRAVVRVGARKVVADRDGRWTLTLPLKQGANRLTFAARDRAGRVTRRSITVHY